MVAVNATYNYMALVYVINDAIMSSFASVKSANFFDRNDSLNGSPMRAFPTVA